MPGIDPRIIEYDIKTYLDAIPIQQCLWVINSYNASENGDPLQIPTYSLLPKFHVEGVGHYDV